MLERPAESSRVEGAYPWLARTAAALALDTARFTAAFWSAAGRESPSLALQGTQALPGLLTQYLTGGKWLNCSQIPQP